MSEEKTQGTGSYHNGCSPRSENNENTVEVTFLPEGKTVTFEHGKLPYKDHGKEESLLDVALEFRHSSRSRLRRKLRLHDLPRLGERRRGPDLGDGRRRSRQARHGRRSSVKLAPRMPDRNQEAGQTGRGDSGVEPELRPKSEEH
jgi:hypothetical protein